MNNYNSLNKNQALFMGVFNHIRISYQWKMIKQVFKEEHVKSESYPDIEIFKWALVHDLVNFH